MRIYPAIHISDGRCINELPDGITRGRILTSQPLEMARRWQDQGAECLHVVDLDGADSGTSVNGTVIREILENVHIPVQVGGGIRSIKDIDQYMNIGVHRVVIGTQAIENPEKLLIDPNCIHQKGRPYQANVIFLLMTSPDGGVLFHSQFSLIIQ